jgi:hypothetical protein
VKRLEDWINAVAKSNRALAALLRGLHDVNREGDTLTFLWHSDWHIRAGQQREAEIRRHLGGLQGCTLVHLTLDEFAQRDPMLRVALELGGKPIFLDEGEIEWLSKSS